MPNYTLDRYMFEGGYDVWWLDFEKSKGQKEIARLRSEISALHKAEKKELDSLVKRYHDHNLYNINRGQRDHRISRKLRLIWEEQEEAEDDMVECGRELEVIQSKIDQCRHY